MVNDVPAHLFGGRGGKGDDGHFGEITAQRFQVAVFRAKLVAPLRYAMGLVNGEQAKFDAAQEILKLRRSQPLRSHVEDLEAPSRAICWTRAIWAAVNELLMNPAAIP